MTTKKKIKYGLKVKDFVDFDYLKKLNEEEYNFLMTFINEFYCCRGARDDSLHVKMLGPEIKKDVYRDNNSRTTDLYNYAKMGGNMKQHNEDYDKRQVDGIEVDSEDPKVFVDELVEYTADIIDNTECNTKAVLNDFAFQIMRFALKEIKQSQREKNRNRHDKYVKRKKDKELNSESVK